MMPTGWCPGRRAGESEVAATRRQLAEYRGTRAVRKFFPEQLGGWVDALSLLQPGMTAVVSYHGFGAPVEALVAAIPPGVAVRLSPWHEPEKKLTPAQFLGEFRHLDGVVPRDHPLRVAGILQFGPTMTVYRARVGAPADLRRFVTPELVALVDFVAWDWYPSNPAERTPTSPAGYEPPESAFRLMLDFAAETGLPWAVSEINHEDIGTTPAAAWYRSAFAYAKANGCQWWAHFHRGGGDLTNPASPRPEMAAALRDLIEGEADDVGAQRRLAWINRGSPFRLMTPLTQLRDRLRDYGYTVYDIGNTSHLEHDPPEDHTPYSATGYPGEADYGVGYAIDIMPPPAGSGLPSLQKLGAQLLADRKGGVAGVKWLKYMNWEPERNNGGDCWHESWQPTYVRRSSSDRGHIHLSGLTGYETSTIAAGYDPVARTRGEDIMATLDELRTVVRDELREALPFQSAGIAKANPTVKGISVRQLLEYAWSDAKGARGEVALLRQQLAGTVGGDVDEDAIVAGILAGLSPEKIAAAIPADIADQVADRLAARLAS